MVSRDTISVNITTEKTRNFVRRQLRQPWESTHVQKSGLATETKPRKEFDTMSSQLSINNDRFPRVTSGDTIGSFQPEAYCHTSDSSPSHNPSRNHAWMDRGEADRCVAQKQLQCLVFGCRHEKGDRGIVELVLIDRKDDLLKKAKSYRRMLYQPKLLLDGPGLLTIGNNDNVICELTSESWNFDNPKQTLPAAAFWNDPLHRHQKQLRFTAKLRSDISEDDDTYIRIEVSSSSDKGHVKFIIELPLGQSLVSATTLRRKLDERTNPDQRVGVAEEICGTWEQLASRLAPNLFNENEIMKIQKRYSDSRFMQARTMLDNSGDALHEKATCRVLINHLLAMGRKTQAYKVFPGLVTLLRGAEKQTYN